MPPSGKDGTGDIDWLSNFPREYQDLLAAQEQVPGPEITPKDHTKPAQPLSAKRKADARPRNANLSDATRRYISLEDRRKTPDRRQSSASKDGQERRKNDRRKHHYSTVLRYAGLRDIAPDLESDAARVDENNFAITPLRIDGLEYNVLITDTEMYIGCVGRPISEWKTIKDRDILTMDGKRALVFWQKHKSMLLIMAENHMHKAKEAQTVSSE